MATPDHEKWMDEFQKDLPEKKDDEPQEPEELRDNEMVWTT